MTQVPQKPLVPNNTLITSSPEEGRALAVMLARNSIHAMQGELETLKTGRAQYAHDPYGLIAASHVVAVEFQRRGGQQLLALTRFQRLKLLPSFVSISTPKSGRWRNSEAATTSGRSSKSCPTRYTR